MEEQRKEILKLTEALTEALKDKDKALADRERVLADRDKALADKDKALTDISRKLEAQERETERLKSLLQTSPSVPISDDIQ